MADFLGMDSRSRKLQQEQQKRREAAKLRIEREKRAKEAAAKDQAKYEEQNRARKLEQRRLEEEVSYPSSNVHSYLLKDLPPSISEVTRGRRRWSQRPPVVQQI